MAPNNENITIGRSTLGTAFGFIGVAGLLFAIIAFAWYVRFSAVVVAALFVGLVSLLLWAAVAPKDFVATLTGRQARYGTSATLAALLLLGIIVLSYIIVARANIAVDTTLSRTFSLSDATFDVLERIPPNRTVQITGFYSADALQERALDDQFLRQYELESNGRVVVEYINPDEQPAVAQRFGVSRDGELFITLLDDEGNIDFDTLTYVPRENKQERDVTSAIQRMLNRRVFTVYFAENLATMSIYNEGDEGLTLLDNNLRLNGVLTDDIDLSFLAVEGGSIPDDAAVVVLPRPILPTTEAEVAVLDEYLQRGGGLLILADITFNEADGFLFDDDPFSAYLAENYGLSAGEAVIVDPPYQVETPLDIIAAATYLEHPVGAAVQQEGTTFFRIARPVNASAEKPATVANGRIMSSSPQSYAETNLDALISRNEFEQDPDAPPGPFDLVVWAQDVAENGGNGSKIVLIGDGNFAMSRNIDSGAAGNATLFTQSILWLAGTESDEVSFGFQAAPSSIPTMFISGRQLDLIGLVIVVLVPLVVLLTGVIVWYRRTFA